ncbi:hypothetical protein OC846_006368, partial [Tilletia horrida]
LRRRARRILSSTQPRPFWNSTPSTSKLMMFLALLVTLPSTLGLPRHTRLWPQVRPPKQMTFVVSSFSKFLRPLRS